MTSSKRKNKKGERVILHIDMDYFFAQIEERENPQFRGKPLVVGADPKKGKGRGVVSTSNYEAREYGIKSGMPISRSYKLCPDAIFLPVNMDLYKKVSERIFGTVKEFSSKIERISLDEAYLDLSKKVGSFKEAENIGKKIKEKIFEKENLTCSIGISKNKMMAKIACELAKPKGIRVITPEKVVGIISEMGVEVVPGIGPKTKDKLRKKLKKRDPKVRDAQIFSKEELINFFGKRGGEFYEKFRGKDSSPVKEEREVKTIGKEHTFQQDTKNPRKITSIFKQLIGDVYRQAKGRKVKGVTVTCRYEDFETHTKQTSFPAGEYDERFLIKKGTPLLLKFLTQSNKKVRLIGFRVTLYG